MSNGWIDLIKLPTKYLTDICEVYFFLRFWHFEMKTSWQLIYTFFFAALSQSQFCFDFLQNLTQDRKLSSTVCYLKSARSVRKFRQYGEPRFQKKFKMAAKNKCFETRQVRCLFWLKLTCWSRIWWYLVDWMRHFRSKRQKMPKLK